MKARANCKLKLFSPYAKMTQMTWGHLIYYIVQNFDWGNIDGLASFRSLMEKILTDSLRQPVFTIQMEILNAKNLMDC